MTHAAKTLLSPRLLRFGIVGAGAALTFFALCFLFRISGVPPFAGTIVAYALAFVGAYGAQRSWTFAGVHDHGQAFPRYLTVQIGCALMSGVVGHVAVERFGLSAFMMSATVTLIASVASYVLSSRWVFPTRMSARS